MDERGKKVMCTLCREKFYKDELKQVTKTKKVCARCESTAYKESIDFKNLIDFICKGFNIKAPTGGQLKAISDFKNRGYLYSEIHATLYYIFVIEKKVAVGNSIGLVPYYYEKAKLHFETIERAKETAKQPELKEVVIKRNKQTNLNVKNTRIVNMEDIT